MMRMMMLRWASGTGEPARSAPVGMVGQLLRRTRVHDTTRGGEPAHLHWRRTKQRRILGQEETLEAAQAASEKQELLDSGGGAKLGRPASVKGGTEQVTDSEEEDEEEEEEDDEEDEDDDGEDEEEEEEEEEDSPEPKSRGAKLAGRKQDVGSVGERGGGRSGGQALVSTKEPASVGGVSSRKGVTRSTKEVPIRGNLKGEGGKEAPQIVKRVQIQGAAPGETATSEQRKSADNAEQELRSPRDTWGALQSDVTSTMVAPSVRQPTRKPGPSPSP
eukprot:2669468-Rhodomonas_salina.11